MDAALFSDVAGDAVRPPGLLHGLTPIPSATGSGAEGIASDLALLAQAISDAGINADTMTIITTAALAMKVKTLASAKPTNTVMSSSALPAGTVIGIIPAALATGYSGAVTIDVSNSGSIHLEDTAPADIVGGGVAASPVKSSFQAYFLVVKVRGWCAWAIRPGSIALINDANW